MADQRETKAIAQAIHARVRPAKPTKPKTFLAQLDLKPGEKRKYVSPKGLSDVQLIRGRLNGKGNLFESAEKTNGGYNFYRRGVVVKMRQRPGGKLKVVAINTSPKKARVGVRYKGA